MHAELILVPRTGIVGRRHAGYCSSPVHGTARRVGRSGGTTSAADVSCAGEGGDTIDLFAPDLAPFTVALLVMLAIGLVELVALVTGFSASGSIESALPEVPDLDAPDLEGGFGPLSHTLGWLSVGKLPVLALLVIFLSAFGLAGYAVQWIATSVLGVPLNGWIAALPALVGGAYATRHLGRWLGRIFPRDHTEVASQKELVGSYATILRGEAVQGQPAEAKTTDLRGRAHYVLIEPQEPGVTYLAGQRVFIVAQENNIYRAVTRLKPEEGTQP